MSLSAILESLVEKSVEAKNFHLLITKEIEYQKEENKFEAWVEFPYNKYVFVCAAILKAILEDYLYKVDLTNHMNRECSMNISWKKTIDSQETFVHPLEKADNLALEDDFISAINLYETIREGDSLNIMFKIVLCALASDDMMIYKKKLDTAHVYEWSNNEITFLEELVQHVIDYDIKSFTKTVRKFNDISPFDAWTTTILLKIKNNIRP